jgi:hypothetical protein
MGLSFRREEYSNILGLSVFFWGPAGLCLTSWGSLKIWISSDTWGIS